MFVFMSLSHIRYIVLGRRPFAWLDYCPHPGREWTYALTVLLVRVGVILYIFQIFDLHGFRTSEHNMLHTSYIILIGLHVWMSMHVRTTHTLLYEIAAKIDRSGIVCTIVRHLSTAPMMMEIIENLLLTCLSNMRVNLQMLPLNASARTYTHVMS